MKHLALPLFESGISELERIEPVHEEEKAIPSPRSKQKAHLFTTIEYQRRDAAATFAPVFRRSETEFSALPGVGKRWNLLIQLDWSELDGSACTPVPRSAYLCKKSGSWLFKSTNQ